MKEPLSTSSSSSSSSASSESCHSNNNNNNNEGEGREARVKEEKKEKEEKGGVVDNKSFSKRATSCYYGEIDRNDDQSSDNNKEEEEEEEEEEGCNNNSGNDKDKDKDNDNKGRYFISLEPRITIEITFVIYDMKSFQNGTTIAVCGNGYASLFSSMGRLKAATRYDHSSAITSIVELNDGHEGRTGCDNNVVFTDGMGSVWFWRRHDFEGKNEEKVKVDSNSNNEDGDDDAFDNNDDYDNLQLRKSLSNCNLTAFEDAHHGGSPCVWAVVRTRDGNLVTASGDNTLKVWKIDETKQSGFCVQTLRGHQGTVFDVCETRDGSRLISCSADMTVKIWKKAEKKENEDGEDREECSQHYELEHTLVGHQHYVRRAIELADGTIASASHDETIRLWNRHTGESCGVLKGHAGSVLSLVEVEDGILVSGGTDGVRVWRTSTGVCLNSFEMKNVYRVLCLSDGSLAYCTSGEGRVFITDTWLWFVIFQVLSSISIPLLTRVK